MSKTAGQTVKYKAGTVKMVMTLYMLKLELSLILLL